MKRSWKRNNENKAISLIEVIDVVLIIGIASTIAVLSVGYAYGSSANHCAKRLSYLLDLTRTESMGLVEGIVVLRLEKTSSGYDAISLKKDLVTGTFVEIDREEIGNSGLKVYYVDSTMNELSNIGDFIDFSYKKNSGAFKSAYKSIQIIGSKTATVTLVKETGRNYVN